MNRAQIMRRGTGAGRTTAHGGPAITAPLPHLFEPATSSPPARGALFNLNAKPGYYNAAAKAALLRREKKGPPDELFIDFSGPAVHVELLAAGRLLASGPWTWEATTDGAPLAAAGKWSEVCWHREDSCDYLEIELPLAGGWKLERQMLLARPDRFLFVADALLGPGSEAVEICYQQALPLAGNVNCQPARETREAAFTADGRPRALAFPVALGEWRAEFAGGELESADQRLTLRAAACGRRIFSPLWIDLDPRRLARPRTWRRLSVGENLAIVPRDVAAGYRIQAGHEQWLIYRSLTEFGNRSVLGHNTAYSFVCGRLKKDGNLDEILAIE
jgi:hypothetical protein